MSTEAGRPRDTHVPLPPVAPPRPTAPPRTPAPPRISVKAEPDGPPSGAAPLPEDEPTTRVAPRRTTRAEAPAAAAPSVHPTAPKPKPSTAPPRPQRRPVTAPPSPPGEVRPDGSQAGRSPAPAPPPPRHPPRPAGVPRVSVLDDDISGPPTFRLRPIRDEEPRRPPLRTVATVACLVLGVGLLGGTTAGTLLTGDAEAGASPAQVAFDEARGLWHTLPVDTLFPRIVEGEGTGPGGADRRWTRVAVAPDATCRNALDPLLIKALSPVGCHRLVRATYADETSTSVVTVGIVFTEAGRAGMRDLRERFQQEELGERADLMPRPYTARGTVAADFGDAQRASWTVRVLTDAPAIVYAVSGFADGRTVSEPQPAAEATDPKATSAPAQAGLGHDAKGLADRIERVLRSRLPEAGKEAD
jgi:hypothetical protein